MSDLLSNVVCRVMGPVKSFQGSAARAFEGVTRVTRYAFAILGRLTRRVSPQKATSFATPRDDFRPSTYVLALGLRALSSLLALLLLFLLQPLITNHKSLALAQSTSAGVSGRITDPSGAVVVDAEVEIKNTDTNDSITVKTNGDGLYNIPSLKPGHYLINVRKTGFRSVTVTEVELNIQDNVVRNFALQVGSITETVTINGDDLHINTTDATVGTVVDQTYVKNMPLNGRSFQDLILITPGIVTQSSQGGSAANTGIGATGEFSVNGQRPESNYYTVDGISANTGAAPGFQMLQGAGPSGSTPAATALGTTQALVSVDALQEFRVQSSTYSAQYGRNPGGQFAFETKSGTNELHGSVYDYLRNGFFDSNDWFNNYFGINQPGIRQNDFGGTLGGPVLVPRLYNGRARTFFFVSYEGLRLTAPKAATISYVPDAALRANAPSPLNQALDAFVAPNGPDVANGVAEYIGGSSSPSSLDSTSVRFDHIVNDKLRLFFRFSDTPSSSTSRGTYNQFLTPSNNVTTAFTSRSYTVGITSGFSSRMSNEFRFGYSTNDASTVVVVDRFGGNTPVDISQLIGLGPGNQGVFLFLGGYNIYLHQYTRSALQRQWNFVDAANLSLGRHSLKFGVDYRRLTPTAAEDPLVEGYFYFNQKAVLNNAGFVTGQANAPAYPLYVNVSAFVQDEWRISQRLALSAGLRWDINPAPGVTQGLNAYTVEGTSPNTLALAPQGTPLWQTTWYNFAPRLGVAYVLHRASGRETVVRGGGGVFFDTGQQLGSVGFSGPGFQSSTFQPGSFPSQPTIAPIVNPPVGIQNAAYGFAPHLQQPYTVQWNLSVEQALGTSQALTFSFVGSHAARLLKEDTVRPLSNPNAFVFIIVGNGLTSDYGALQVQFRRRLSRGLTALASYDWSHCIDYGSQNYVFGYQRGSCDFDVRHNLSTAFSYDLPNVGQHAFQRAILHHWGLDTRFSARTGFPVPLNGSAYYDPLTRQQYNSGLDLVSGQPIYLYGANCASVLQGLKDLLPGQGCPGGRAINPQAFTKVSSGLGNAPRNFARGFGEWQANLAVRREFPIHERLMLQFRAEAFNIFNHPNFGNISPYLGTTTFGQATATLASSLGTLNPLYQQGGPRSMQFALKLVF